MLEKVNLNCTETSCGKSQRTHGLPGQASGISATDRITSGWVSCLLLPALAASCWRAQLLAPEHVPQAVQLVDFGAGVGAAAGVADAVGVPAHAPQAASPAVDALYNTLQLNDELFKAMLHGNTSSRSRGWYGHLRSW